MSSIVATEGGAGNRIQSVLRAGKVGLEPSDASILSGNDLQQIPQPSAAQSGAVTAEAILAMLAALSPPERERLAVLLSGKTEGEHR